MGADVLYPSAITDGVIDLPTPPFGVKVLNDKNEALKWGHTHIRSA